MMPQYVIGPEYLPLEGNNELFFALHLGLFTLSAAVIVPAWTRIDSTGCRHHRRASAGSASPC
jgi:hypothetical protein